MGLDIDKLLAPVSDGEPSGEDVTFDPVMLELEQLAEGTKETQFSEGEEADWREVRKLALDLAGRSKHLRVYILLFLSSIKQEGPTGLRDGLALLRGVIENFWDSVWPILDPDDDNDPTERINIISSISPPPDVFGDPLKIKEHVLDIPLTNSRQMGLFTLRDVMKSTGELPLSEKDGGTPPDANHIRGAFEDTPQETLDATFEAFSKAHADLLAVDSFLGNAVGSRFAPNLEVLKGLLKTAVNVISQYRDGGVGGGSESDAINDAGDDAGGGGGGGGAARPAQQSISGEIRNQADVIKTIEKIVSYYTRTEPSSPVPILLDRAKALVGLSFKDIMKNLTPDGLRQLEMYIGSSGSDSSDDY